MHAECILITPSERTIIDDMKRRKARFAGGSIVAGSERLRTTHSGFDHGGQRIPRPVSLFRLSTSIPVACKTRVGIVLSGPPMRLSFMFKQIVINQASSKSRRRHLGSHSPVLNATRPSVTHIYHLSTCHHPPFDSGLYSTESDSRQQARYHLERPSRLAASTPVNRSLTTAAAIVVRLRSNDWCFSSSA